MKIPNITALVQGTRGLFKPKELLETSRAIADDTGPDRHLMRAVQLARIFCAVFSFLALWAMAAGIGNGVTQNFDFTGLGWDWGGKEYRLPLAFHIPMTLVFTFAAFALTGLNLVWPEIVDRLKFKTAGVTKAGMILLGVTIFVFLLLSSTEAVVQTDDAALRAASVAEQTAGGKRDILKAQVERDSKALAVMTAAPGYKGEAASMGAVSAKARLSAANAAPTKNPTTIALRESAVGIAEQADRLRAKIAEAEDDLLALPVEAAVSTTLESHGGSAAVKGAAGWVNDNRGLFYAGIAELGVILLGFVLLALKRLRAAIISTALDTNDENSHHQTALVGNAKASEPPATGAPEVAARPVERQPELLEDAKEADLFDGPQKRTGDPVAADADLTIPEPGRPTTFQGEPVAFYLPRA